MICCWFVTAGTAAAYAENSSRPPVKRTMAEVRCCDCEPSDLYHGQCNVCEVFVGYQEISLVPAHAAQEQARSKFQATSAGSANWRLGTLAAYPAPPYPSLRAQRPACN